MSWKEMKVEVDGKVVCTATKDTKGVHMDCSAECMKICRDFKGNCC